MAQITPPASIHICSNPHEINLNLQLPASQVGKACPLVQNIYIYIELAVLVMNQDLFPFPCCVLPTVGFVLAFLMMNQYLFP